MIKLELQNQAILKTQKVKKQVLENYKSFKISIFNDSKKFNVLDIEKLDSLIYEGILLELDKKSAYYVVNFMENFILDIWLKLKNDKIVSLDNAIFELIK
jgi:hypothetical protein